MTKITDSLSIRGNIIRNRIVMAPMLPLAFYGISVYGNQHVEHYAARAKGGAGLIIMQATSAKGAVASTDLWSADNIAVLKQIVGKCHEYGAGIMLQLHNEYGIDQSSFDINQLSTDQIHNIQMELKQAAISACEIGFEGVEYHCVHGSALCRTIDASYNKRTDQYGGDVINRTRILTELLPEIRKNTHEKFIVGVRMGEYLPESQDGIEAAKTFEKAGFDLLDITFGMKRPEHAVPEDFKCSSVTYSGRKIKKEISIPVIAGNDIRSEEQVRFLIENDYVDFVAIGRGMLADPEFANHAMKGEPINKCLGCGGSSDKCKWFSDHTLCPAINKTKN